MVSPGESKQRGLPLPQVKPTPVAGDTDDVRHFAEATDVSQARFVPLGFEQPLEFWIEVEGVFDDLFAERRNHHFDWVLAYKF